MAKREIRAYDMGYNDGIDFGRAEGSSKGHTEGFRAGVDAGHCEMFGMAHDWLMSHYQEYFALKRPIREFENDFTLAMVTED